VIKILRLKLLPSILHKEFTETKKFPFCPGAKTKLSGLNVTHSAASPPAERVYVLAIIPVFSTVTG